MQGIFEQLPKSSMWLLGFLLAAVVAGCGLDGEGGTPLGALSVSLTDAPACGFDAVNVTVDKVRVHQSSSANENEEGWTTIALLPPRKINLLDLNDPMQPNLALERLGETSLEAGQYNQVRLVLIGNNAATPFANSVVLAGQPLTNEIALDTPSAVQSGIKLVHSFTVAQGQRVDLLLDFDACKSIVKRGNGTYLLKPVIQVIPFELNGIQGFLDTALFPGQVNANNVIVSAQMGGNVVRSTVPNATTGEFFLARLAPGDYDVVITADGRATAVISGVPVPTSSSTTAVSTNTSPLPVTPPTLGISTTRTISGMVTLTPPTDDEPVSVVAKQVLVNGPTVTVKTLAATPVAGNPTGDFQYNLVLPVDRPSLGSYSTPPPITFAQQPVAVGGMYKVQASATGYQAQSFNQDISTVDQTQDFPLVP